MLRKEDVKRMKKLIAVLLVCALGLGLVGCGAGSLIQGEWMTEDQTTKLAFGKDGKAVMTVYNFPLEMTYALESDVLTLYYEGEGMQTGKITFYGDNEFLWEVETEGGGTQNESYYRQ